MGREVMRVSQCSEAAESPFLCRTGWGGVTCVQHRGPRLDVYSGRGLFGFQQLHYCLCGEDADGLADLCTERPVLPVTEAKPQDNCMSR